ncbi:MAG TPA: non-canonical purine NTP pyrophosphatase [Longimicrobiales bacterium]
MASEFLLATRSPDKAREIREILQPVAHVELCTLKDVGIMPSAAEDDVENFPTFLENALAKARYFSRLTGRAVLADDSGLMVAALKGAPGVRTKRFAADHGSDRTDVDEANNDLLLEKLRDVPASNRAARYVCAAACVFPDERSLTAIGTCAGVIAFERKGTGGFGYDPLFLLPALRVTFAQLTAAQKHEHSHRARAFRALAAHLK